VKHPMNAASRLPKSIIIPLLASAAFISIAQCAVAQTEEPTSNYIQVAEDNRSFEFAESGKPFKPFGFNYDHDRGGRLLEDYWYHEWPAIEEDFREMRDLGANVARIHLQFGKFMDSPTEPNVRALDQLEKLLALAKETGIYLDLTGLGCYHKDDVPEWYDALSEAERWDAQAEFWKAVAERCASSDMIFCYDLMNEPVVPGGDEARDDWLGPGFAGKHFVQFITLDRRGRERWTIARDWIDHLVGAIRKEDPHHMITVGFVPWSLDRPGLTSGFIPSKVADNLDFLAMHIYPESDKTDEAIETVRGFHEVGKPVVVEEFFPLKCSLDELETFMDRADAMVAGWIGFYWGQTREQLREEETMQSAIIASYLDLLHRRLAPDAPARQPSDG